MIPGMGFRLDLVEHETTELPPEALSDEHAKSLWDEFRSEVEIEAPSFRTGGCWKITPRGYVGHFKTGSGLDVSIGPKVPLANLFRMLEYAYKLQSFRFLEGEVALDSFDEFLDRLAMHLAHGVLTRARRGFSKTYEGDEDKLPYLRGALDWQRVLSHPCVDSIPCRFEEQTSDNESHRILSWTLLRIARSGRGSRRSRPIVRRAFRAVVSAARPVPVTAVACVGRRYDRLDEDYRPLHILCRFFLENLGPSHDHGERHMIPFLVDMARLYERFVAEWLRENLPPHLRLEAKRKYDIDTAVGSRFEMDLVVSDKATGRVLVVLDTKYKRARSPDAGDVAQVVAYATALECEHAVLVYPSSDISPMDRPVGGKRVRSLAFDVGEDLQAAGRRFLGDLSIC